MQIRVSTGNAIDYNVNFTANFHLNILLILDDNESERQCVIMFFKLPLMHTIYDNTCCIYAVSLQLFFLYSEFHKPC